MVMTRRDPYLQGPNPGSGGGESAQLLGDASGGWQPPSIPTQDFFPGYSQPAPSSGREVYPDELSGHVGYEAPPPSGDYGAYAPPPGDEWQYETPEDVYNFGRMRIEQQIKQLQAIGAAPVAKTPSYMSALGGRLKSWEGYNAAVGAAQANYNRQLKALRSNLQALEERIQYQFPITDIV